VNEAVELLAARAPKLRAALRKARREGMAYVIIDSTLIPIDPDCPRPAVLLGQTQTSRGEPAGHRVSG
jgi:hypothetical protein